ncbi:restriction endonuclease subunit S [Streptococcus intermedius]|uniref:restriction endonuclease subunit S n=1 Tax=Streptococcus intermedius TaxID=1338 RepID=UPI0006609CC3|nr:restriction endonuclease subunit S [Streptococcus intermedius]PMR92236.1 restriction endonuclease subunit S [Streptococcus intermedius]
MEENSLPKLRHAGFEDAWQKSLLIEQVEIRRGLTYKPSDVRNNGVRVLRSSNIAEDTFVISDDDVFVDKGAVNIPRISNGDILVTAANGSTKLVGKHAIVKNLAEDELAVHGGFMLAIKAEQNDFVNAWMSSKEYKRVLQFVQGGNGAIGNLSTSVLKSMKMTIPASIEEQSAIGSLFHTLDDLLADYKENLVNYKAFKASMLSKMFPKSGQIVPEIRLAGFEGEWEKYYLGDIFEQVSNYIEPSVENELWSLTVEKGLTPKTERYKRDFLVKKNDKFKKVDVNEFVYNPMNLTLGALDLNNNEVTVSVSGYYVVMKNRGIEKFDNDFLKILLKTMYAIYQYKQFATGTLIEKQRVQFPTFSEIPFYLPPIAEQQAVGSFFSNLDTLISSYQDKISQLENLKKKLLQDMFI